MFAALAYEAGFNSKTVFNTFSKENGSDDTQGLVEV